MTNSQNWTTEFFAWADANHISAEKLPRDEETLLLQTALNLSFCKLTQLPESLANLTHLTELDLAYNELMQIPEWIDNFMALEKLDVSGNSITSLPDSLRHLPNLVVLGLDKQIRKEEIVAKRSNLPLLQMRQKQQISQKEKIASDKNSDYRSEYEQQNKDGISKMKYQQKILFGSPGTGKSHKIDGDERSIIVSELEITDRKNIIKTVFHPEYTYGDFVGKLVPITRFNGNDEKVEYKFHEGHFLQALGKAYKNIIDAHDKDGLLIPNAKIENVALVIDEINRGNSAAIFGTIFQLLDRESTGWSSYNVNVNEIAFTKLFELCDLKADSFKNGRASTYKLKYHGGDEELKPERLQTRLDFLKCDFENRTIKIPPNLSILASMNTSDSSIYYMDSAFKRRWEWEFIDVELNSVSSGENKIAFNTENEWKTFVSKLNEFIKSNHKFIRGIEDKQIGYYFIKFDEYEKIQKSSVKNKLMFFLWDSVFNRDKKPLVKLLFDENSKKELITFGDFVREVDLFITKINNFKNV